MGLACAVVSVLLFLPVLEGAVLVPQSALRLEVRGQPGAWMDDVPDAEKFLTSSDTDALYRIRKGLANSVTSVSFESVRLPGYYLRHIDFIIKLNQISSQIAREDASYIPTQNADGSYSFASYNFPDRRLLWDGGRFMIASVADPNGEFIFGPLVKAGGVREFRFTPESRRLSGPLLTPSRPLPSLPLCMASCATHGDCLGVNWHRTTAQCELLGMQRCPGTHASQDGWKAYLFPGMCIE